MSGYVIVILALIMAQESWGQPAVTISAAPAVMNFTYQIGSALPPAQTLQIKRNGTGPALDFTVTLPAAANWLIVSPMAGRTGGNASILVNPTSLLAGTYTATIQIDAAGASAPVQVAVNLLVKNPPPLMSASPLALSYSFTTDAAAPPPQSLTVATAGEPVSFTAAVQSTGNWLSIDRTSGIAVSGSPVALICSVATAGLAPGTYTGKITLTSSNASNKTLVVNVTFVVTAGTAVIGSIWPNAVPVGADDATITIRGQHLFKSSVVNAGSVQLTSTFVNNNVLLAVVPKTLLTAQGTHAITVTNSPQPASNAVNFNVTPPGPQVQSVVNSASFLSSSPPVIAPGEILSIFGSGMGPGQVLVASPSGGVYPASLGTPATTVEFELSPGAWTAAPIIFAQSNQVNIVAPFGIPASAGLKLRVTYNGITSSLFTFDGVAADPGLYTVDSSGRGQAAALNYNAATSTYSINSESNAALKGSIVIFYLTGGGALNPPPAQDGQVIPTSGTIPALAGQVSVTIGGDGAAVQSATAVPGSVAGLVQLNVALPSTVRTGKSVPVVVTVDGRSSIALTTIAIK